MFVIEKVEREREREREQGGPLSSYSCRQGGTDRLAMTLINISLTGLHCTTQLTPLYLATISPPPPPPPPSPPSPLTSPPMRISVIPVLFPLYSWEQQTVMGAGGLVRPAAPMISYHVTKEIVTGD